jgi:hypothetical protein
LIAALKVEADEMGFVGDRKRRGRIAGVKKSQSDVFTRNVIPEEIRIFDKEEFVFVPARDFYRRSRGNCFGDNQKDLAYKKSKLFTTRLLQQKKLDREGKGIVQSRDKRKRFCFTVTQSLQTQT